jgi:hypothetical protein
LLNAVIHEVAGQGAGRAVSDDAIRELVSAATWYPNIDPADPFRWNKASQKRQDMKDQAEYIAEAINRKRG